MDKIIDSRFERVERALQTLITSISTYNPTPAHATDLVTADAELSQGLEQLSVHQANHQKILALRNTSVALDLQIRDTLILLTDTRRALLNTPATTFPETSYPVSYSELLSYARRISKFTLPSTYREPEAPAAEAAELNTPKETKSEPHTNGTSTPVAAPNGVDIHTQLSNNTATEVDSATPSNAGGTQAQTSQNTADTSATALPAGFTEFLNQFTNLPFTPWPTEQAIRRGALASIQVLLDQGMDPATFDPEKSAELEAERKRIVEEDERIKGEERERIEEDMRRREMERRMSVSGSASGDRRPEPERPKVFQLETFDDDDESD